MNGSARRDPIPFHPRFNDRILSGEKYVTRRFRPRHVDDLLRAKNPVPGKQPSRWPGFADLRVASCRSVRLQAIDHADARREGCDSVLEFEQFWREIYHDDHYRGWDRNPAVWRIEFVCLTPSPARQLSLQVPTLNVELGGT